MVFREDPIFLIFSDWESPILIQSSDALQIMAFDVCMLEPLRSIEAVVLCLPARTGELADIRPSRRCLRNNEISHHSAPSAFSPDPAEGIIFRKHDELVAAFIG
jgi:hypothetical protein